MADTLEERLRAVLANMPAEDVHAVAAFAEFLYQRRKWLGWAGERRLSDDEHARITAALDHVAALPMQQGPPVSNRHHDKYVYGGE